MDYICRNDSNKETKSFPDWRAATSFVNDANRIETRESNSDPQLARWWVEALTVQASEESTLDNVPDQGDLDAINKEHEQDQQKPFLDTELYL